MKLSLFINSLFQQQQYETYARVFILFIYLFI